MQPSFGHPPREYTVDEDRLLGKKKQIFDDALILWTKYKTNRVGVPDEAIRQMKDYSDRA